MQSAESNQSSENYSPIKSDNKKSELEEPILEATAVRGRNYLKSDNMFSKFSETSI